MASNKIINEKLAQRDINIAKGALLFCNKLPLKRFKWYHSFVIYVSDKWFYYRVPKWFL